MTKERTTARFEATAEGGGVVFVLIVMAMFYLAVGIIIGWWFL